MKPTNMVWFAWDLQNAAHVEPHERRQAVHTQRGFVVLCRHKPIVFN